MVNGFISNRRFSACVVLAFLALTVSGCSSSHTRKLSDAEVAQLYITASRDSMMSGELTQALQDILTAEKSDPSSPDVHHVKALVYAAKKNFALAIVSARKAVALKPDYSAANNTLGRLLLENGQVAEGISYLKKAAADPLYMEAYKPWTSLGIHYYRQGEMEEATRSLKEAVSSAPTGACIAYYYLGHISLQKGKFSDAVRNYGLATRRYCANFADAHLALGIAFEREKEYDQARKKFLEIREKFADSAAAEQATNHLKFLP